MSRRPGRPPRVVAYGFLGMGNIGNEGSLSAFRRRLHCLLPGARLSCLATDPERVRAEHGLPGRSLMTGGGRPHAAAVKAALRLVDVPRTWWLVGRADAVVVPGMGVLESSLGAANPFGLPYWMWVLAVCARVRRRPLLLVSVGADRPHHPVTAFFFRRVVRLAAYTSFRDDLSADAVRALCGVADPGPVRPDLAFGLPVPDGTGAPLPGRVVVGVMRFSSPDPGAMDRYLREVSHLVSRLAASGDSVRLVVGDVADFPVAEEIAAGARAEAGCEDDRVAVSRAHTQEGVMAEMGRAEVVVASRYHNVIAALRVGVPVVSLGYAGKNAVLLERFGLDGLDQPIDSFDPDLLARQVTRARGLGRIPGHDRVMAELEASLSEQDAVLRRLLERH